MMFKGYIRPDGEVGVRNHFLIIPSVICANKVAVEISRHIENSVVIPHQNGCGQLENDAEQTARILYNFGKNGNVGGVLVVGLGCETLSPDEIADEISRSGKPVDTIIIQEEGGTTKSINKGVEKGKRIVQEISIMKRESVDLDSLIVGVECGASDTTSGLVANPAVGRTMDRVIEEGGSVVFGETTEMIGAEHILAKRAVNNDVAENIIETIVGWEEKIKSLGLDIRGANPSPGNIKAGITTIEEKSLGAILKAGTHPIKGVLKYGEKIYSRGLFIMDTPGQDIESISGLIAGGAQLIVFTTGVGTPTGAPITPVIKVTGNYRTYRNMYDDIDVDVSGILRGEETINSAGERIFNYLLKVISSEKTFSEIHGHREFAINRLSPTL